MIYNVVTWRLGAPATIDSFSGEVEADTIVGAATIISQDNRTRLGDIMSLSEGGETRGVVGVDWYGKATLKIENVDDEVISHWSSLLMMDHHTEPERRIH